MDLVQIDLVKEIKYNGGVNTITIVQNIAGRKLGPKENQRD